MKSPADLLKSWILLVINRPKTIIAFAIIITTVFSLGITRLGFTASPREFMGEGEELMIQLIALEEEYVKDINIQLMFKSRSGNIFTADNLMAIAEATEKSWQLPNLQRIDSLANFQYTHADADDLIVRNLIEIDQTLTATEAEQIRNIAEGEPRFKGYFVSEDGVAAGANLLFNINLGHPQAIQSVIDQISEINNSIEEKYSDIDVAYAGYLSLANRWDVLGRHDISVLFPSATVLIFIGLVIFLRNIRAATATLTMSVLSVIIALGYSGFSGAYLAPVTSMGVLMILVLAIADAVHIIKSVTRFLNLGMTYREAISESINQNFKAIALTSITTAIGFLSFNLSEFAAIRYMGNYVAFGVIVAFFLSISFVPALLCYCGLKPDQNIQNDKRYTQFADFIIGNRKWLLLLTGPAILASIYIVHFNVVDESFMRMIHKKDFIRINSGKIEQSLTGTSGFLVSIESGKPGGVSDPEFMDTISEFTDWARQQPEVRYVNSFSDTLKQLNKNLHEDNPDYYRIPETKDLAAQYVLLYEMSLPYGVDLTNQINLDKSSTRLMLITNEMSVEATFQFVEHLEKWLDTNTPNAKHIISGSTYTTAIMIRANVIGMLTGSILALVIIGTILLFTFRSFIPGLLCVITIVSPILAAYALWAIFVGIVDLPATVVICMVIGIAVDNSVHFISKFQYAIKHYGESPEGAVHYAFTRVGNALVTNAFALSAGFMILLFSKFTFYWVMGALTTMCILLSLVTTFILLPCLLLIRRHPERRFALSF